MEVFEIHITGDEKILKAAHPIKTISVDLLRPDLSVLRTEHMTSHVSRHSNFDMCREYVDDVVAGFKEKGVEIVRVKIECPFYEHYRDRSLYIESHFEATGTDFPISRNRRKATALATDREYDKAKFDLFRERWVGQEVELCLYDTFVEEDRDWFELYWNTMTQEELNKIYKDLQEQHEEDPEEADQQYWKRVEELGADFMCWGWKAGSGESVIDYLKIYGFRVLEDPQYEGSDTYGYVVFPPKCLKKAAK